MRIREISEYGLERRDSKNSEKDKEKSEKSQAHKWMEFIRKVGKGSNLAIKSQ